jgi:uncharacterized membrane protein SirB2
MDYTFLKLLHQSAVVLSGLGFAARGWGSLRGAAWVRSRSAKTLPHIVDTVLLASALALAWMLRLNPASSPWLMVKILGLLAYIALGMVALRPRFPTALRAVAWVLALLLLAWIATVAVFKNPLGVFSLLL